MQRSLKQDLLLQRSGSPDYSDREKRKLPDYQRVPVEFQYPVEYLLCIHQNHYQYNHQHQYLYIHHPCIHRYLYSGEGYSVLVDHYQQGEYRQEESP
jgi:hypothetical protein